MGESIKISHPKHGSMWVSLKFLKKNAYHLMLDGWRIENESN
jgi:hypothetical protein